MTILLHDLAAIDDRRPSPFCWRIKLALGHKGLSFETSPAAFTDIPNISKGDKKLKTVPILEDGSNLVGDSWAIADYLDEAYPNAPKLFETKTERALCQLVETWLFADVFPLVFPMYVLDIYNLVQEKDREYFRKTRERGLRKTIEEASADREEKLDAARKSFAPLRLLLAKKDQPFVSGEKPGYGDYIASGVLLWIASVATMPLLAKDDALLPWLERVQDLYGGIGRSAKLYAIAG